MKDGFEYDEEDDILYIHNLECKGEALFSIDIDDNIIDIGKKGEIVGVEIMDASLKFSKDENERKMMKEALKNIKQSFFSVKYEFNSFTVRIGFFALIEEQQLREGMLIQVPIRKEMMIKA